MKRNDFKGREWNYKQLSDFLDAVEKNMERQKVKGAGKRGNEAEKKIKWGNGQRWFNAEIAWMLNCITDPSFTITDYPGKMLSLAMRTAMQPLAPHSCIFFTCGNTPGLYLPSATEADLLCTEAAKRTASETETRRTYSETRAGRYVIKETQQYIHNSE